MREFGLPPERRPCPAMSHGSFKTLGADAFEEAVGGWLARTAVVPQDPLAVDGKTLRGVHGGGARIHLAAAHDHQTQVVIAQLRTEGKGQEFAATKEVLAGLP